MTLTSRKHQAGWNIFEITWLIVIGGLAALGLSYGRQHLGGPAGAISGAVVGAIAGVLAVAALRFLIAAIFRRGRWR